MNKIKKSNITRFEFIGIIVVSVLLFFVIVPTAFAVSETRYHRSDTHTINGLNAYQLGTSQSGTELDFNYCEEGDLDCLGGMWKADVYKRDAAGTETLFGSNVAALTGQYNGYQSAIWNVPETILSPTDAIKVVEKLGSETRIWITPQLNAIKLNAATWTFWRYCSYDCIERSPEACYPEEVCYDICIGLYHGSSSSNTRIENFSYTPAVSYVDCGLRIRTGTLTLTIACEPAGTLTSPLRIRKGATTYGIVLVATTDANASPIRINTSSGVKALRKY